MDRAEVHGLLDSFLGAALRIQDQDLADRFVQRKNLRADIHAGPAADAFVEIDFRVSGRWRFHRVICRFAAVIGHWPFYINRYFSRSRFDISLIQSKAASTVFSKSGLTRQQVAGDSRLCARSCSRSNPIR